MKTNTFKIRNLFFKNFCFKKVKILFLLLLMNLFFLQIISAKSFFDYPISTVFIDAGHGGMDSGAVASYDFDPLIEEKNIVLEVALGVEKYLNKALSDINVVQIRDDDTYYTLQERSEFAYKYPLEDKSSSIFVSIHANSASSNSAKGFEIFTKLEKKQVDLFDEETPVGNIDLFVNEKFEVLSEQQYQTSYQLALEIENAFKKDFPQLRDRGIKSDDLYVLNVCRTTGCLIEIGFLSNKDEANLLTDSAYLNNISKTISDGIVEYIKKRR